MIVKTIQKMNDEMWSKYHGLHESFINYAPEMMHKAIEEASNCDNQVAQLGALKLLNFKPICLTEDKYGPYSAAEYIIAAGLVIKKANNDNHQYNDIIKKALEIVKNKEEIAEYLFH